MVRVTDHDPPARDRFLGQCLHCMRSLEAVRAETRRVAADNFGNDLGYVDCPVCRHSVTVYVTGHPVLSQGKLRVGTNH